MSEPLLIKGSDLIDKGIELIAGCGRLTVIKLGLDVHEFVDQPSGLILCEAASSDECLHLIEGKTSWLAFPAFA